MPESTFAYHSPCPINSECSSETKSKTTQPGEKSSTKTPTPSPIPPSPSNGSAKTLTTRSRSGSPYSSKTAPKPRSTSPTPSTPRSANKPASSTAKSSTSKTLTDTLHKKQKSGRPNRPPATDYTHELSNNRPRHNPLSPHPSHSPLSRPSTHRSPTTNPPNPQTPQRHNNTTRISFKFQFLVSIKVNKELINPRPKHHRPSTTHTTLFVPCFKRFQILPHKIHSPQNSTKKRAPPKECPHQCISFCHQQLIVSDESP